VDRALLARHAETAWSKTGKHTGRTDIPLTDAGREHARALGALLAGHRFALVLSSPLSRARESAQIAGLTDVQLRDDLVEWDYGHYEGRTTPEIREDRPGWFLWRDGVPGGEGIDDVGARCDRVIEEIRGVEGDVAIVAHGHVLRVLAARWIGQPPAFGSRLHLDTAALSMIGFERDVEVLSRWNAPVTAEARGPGR
jgi:broad specificity phosphatase PhoE